MEVLRIQLDDTLADLGKKLGISLKIGNCSFDPYGKFANFKLKVAVVGENGTIETVEVSDFKRFATMYGMEPNDLGRSFSWHNGKTFKITGFNVRARGKGLLAVNVATGKSYKFSPKDVACCLK